MICSRGSANHKGCLRLHWGVHKGLSLSWPQTSSNDHQDLIWFSTIESPRRRGQYKLFEAHHNLSGSRRTPTLSRGQVSKSNEHTKIIGKVLCLKIEWVAQQKSLLWRLDLSEDRGRQSLSSRSFGSKDFQVNWVAKWVEGAETPFYWPHRESARWGVRDPDMSDQETGYVWKRLLEPGPSAGHIRCTNLTRG
jgi:hypothetical protein